MLEAFVSVKIVQLLATRRSDLVPHTLHALRKVSIPVASLIVLILAGGLSGCSYEGIDGTVFGEAAETAGRPPTDSLVDLSQGEVGLAMSKAEGNLKFLAQADMATFTQGEAVLDALHALQEARKAYAEVTKELAELKDGLIHA